MYDSKAPLNRENTLNHFIVKHSNAALIYLESIFYVQEHNEIIEKL